MKKKIAVVLLSAGCLAVPACLETGMLGGFGVSDVGLNICVPGEGFLNVCADVTTPVDLDGLFDDLFDGEAVE